MDFLIEYYKDIEENWIVLIFIWQIYKPNSKYFYK